MNIAKAYLLGFIAGFMEKDVTTCPYPDDAMNESARSLWLNGYSDADNPHYRPLDEVPQ